MQSGYYEPVSNERTTTVLSPRVRLTGLERRLAILGSARAEFARHGFHGASTASIAQRAGCSEPMLYKHYASKEALFVEALQDAHSKFREGFAQALEPQEYVLALVDRYITQVIPDPEFVQLQQLRLLAATIADRSAVHALLMAIDRESREHIANAVLIGIEQGDVRPDVDPDYIAACWQGLMLAGCYNELLVPGSFAEMLPHARTFIMSTATPS